jgi:hypothetical protein
MLRADLGYQRAGAKAVQKAQLSLCVQKAELYLFTCTESQAILASKYREIKVRTQMAHLSLCAQKAELRGLLYGEGFK